MSEKILSEDESKRLFKECLKHPAFVLELNEYEKQKVLDLAFEEFHIIQEKEVIFRHNPDDTSILNEFEKFRLHMIKSNFLNIKTEENQLTFFLTDVSENALSLKVLFHNLGFVMSFKNLTIMPIEMSLSDKEYEPEKAIVFQEGILEKIYSGIKAYFNEGQLPDLKSVLEGNPINEKLIFNANKNQLPELIKCLEYNDHIIRPKEKKELANWIEANFTTQKGTFSFDSLNEFLSKTSFSVKKDRRLCPKFPRLTESQLKERNNKNRK